MEIYDVYNEKGKRTGKTAEGVEFLAEGELLLGIHAYICNRHGQYLIQRRSLNKRILPGIWDIHMGHVASGETSEEGLLREIREEIGISLDPSAIRGHKRFVWLEQKHIVDLYFIRADIDLCELTLREEEVSDAKYIQTVEMLNLILSMNRPDPYKCLAIRGVSSLISSKSPHPVH